jgi:hypothetical protein
MPPYASASSALAVGLLPRRSTVARLPLLSDFSSLILGIEATGLFDHPISKLRLKPRLGPAHCKGVISWKNVGPICGIEVAG